MEPKPIEPRNPHHPLLHSLSFSISMTSRYFPLSTIFQFRFCEANFNSIRFDSIQGDFSFDALFGNLVNELLPSFKVEAESDGADSLPNGHMRAPSSDASKFSQTASSPLFPDVEKLLSLFKDSCKELLELRKQVI